MSNAGIRSDARAFVDSINASPLARMETMSVTDVRATLKAAREAANLAPRDIAVRRDLNCLNGAVRIPLRLYDVRHHRGPGPVVVFYHGGGFVMGDLDTHDTLCVMIAENTGMPVVAVDYRLAPEHPWPAAPDDAEAVARWVADRLGDVANRKTDSLVLAGDSAGGNLAAVTARALRDRPASKPVAAQYLIYPCIAAETYTFSRRAFAEGLFLTKESIDWFFDHYAALDGDPRIDLMAGSLEGMPPTVIVTAGFDPLRDEGRDYACALIQSGVPVTYQDAIGNVHGCFSMTAAIPSTTQDVVRSLAALTAVLPNKQTLPWHEASQVAEEGSSS